MNPFSLADEPVDGVCLAEARVEACDVFGTFDLLDSGLAVLQIAPVRAVVHQRQVRVNLETLELETLRVLLENLCLREEIVHVHAISCHYI